MVNVCPVSAAALLDFLVKELSKKDFFSDPERTELHRLAWEITPVLPEDYFPDTYLDVELNGREKPMLAFRMDSRECNLVNHETDGRYFAECGVPAVLMPEQYGRISVIACTEDRMIPMELDKAAISLREASYPSADPQNEPPAVRALLARLAGFPVATEIRCHGDERTVIFTGGTRSPRQRFSKTEYAARLLSLLEELGAPEKQLSRLIELPCNYRFPCYDEAYGYMDWLCRSDIAYFSVTFRGAEALRFHVGILLTDKCMEHRGEAVKPVQAYQWHITDICDQRCRHCYLYAEDALHKCVSTPWDMLMRTMDECTMDAARRHARPMLYITGGDPIMHPRFWDFAVELHRRGIYWNMMGNPFHLDPEVCVRLRQLGVRVYQMSLDGLEPFHDYMRMPGSYRATLNAVRLLNDAGIGSQLMATASRRNLDDIIALMDVAAEYNAESFVFARYCATSKDKAEDYPAPEEYRRFLERYLEKSRELRLKGCGTRFIQKEHLFTLLKWERGEFTVPEYSKAHPDTVYEGCHLGQSLTILSDGDVMACRRMESVVGNVWTESLSGITSGDALERYADVKEITRCRDCELLNWCRGCRAVGFNATGDIHAADPCCWKKSE